MAQVPREQLRCCRDHPPVVALRQNDALLAQLGDPPDRELEQPRRHLPAHILAVHHRVDEGCGRVLVKDLRGCLQLDGRCWEEAGGESVQAVDALCRLEGVEGDGEDRHAHVLALQDMPDLLAEDDVLRPRVGKEDAPDLGEGLGAGGHEQREQQVHPPHVRHDQHAAPRHGLVLLLGHELQELLEGERGKALHPLNLVDHQLKLAVRGVPADGTEHGADLLHEHGAVTALVKPVEHLPEVFNVLLGHA
mmetsp:Transcript_38741/g.95323  ORF Transcript_38741/g.95323 Transcript_38741/m.95323 type:complete len:249 (-) Transcript_38741:1208-1954(-)